MTAVAGTIVALPQDERPTVAIVGAGFSGTLLALHLLRQAETPVRVILIERNAQFGRGAAYATGNSSHVLNVPAGKMSGFHGDPLNFLRWLHSVHAASDGCPPPAADTFVPRHIYGRYVRHLLNAEIKQREDRLELVRGDVTDIVPDARGLTLRLDRDRLVRADRAVLAVGNFPPAPPPVADPSFYDTPFYRADPWGTDTLSDLDPDAPVLLIGTGLTMVDTLVSLLDEGHRGLVTALSRRGLLPNRHAGRGGGPGAGEADAYPTRVTALSRFLRARSDGIVRRGGSWQEAIDEIRPLTTELWQAMPLAERRRFLRHIRPWWDIHRHRIAGPVADRVDAARKRGQLQVRAGHVSDYTVAGDRVLVRYRPRARDDSATVEAARVINCAGPNADYSRIRDPLIRSLLGKKLVRPDPLCLGLDVTGFCALVDDDGRISRRLFAIGPVTRGMFWEMTAVPDIRQQAEFLASRLAAISKPPLRAPTPLAEARSA